MVNGDRRLPDSRTSGCSAPNSSTWPRFSAGAFMGRRKRGCAASDKRFSSGGPDLRCARRAVNEGSLAGHLCVGRNMEHGARDAVIVEQPVQLSHRSFPSREAYERKWKTQNMTEQDPGPAPDLAAIGFAHVDDFPTDHVGRPEQAGERLGRRAEHGIDGVAMVGIAERNGDEDETIRTYDLDTAPGESFGIAHVLQDIAAENGFGP